MCFTDAFLLWYLLCFFLCVNAVRRKKKYDFFFFLLLLFCLEVCVMKEYEQVNKLGPRLFVRRAVTLNPRQSF